MTSVNKKGKHPPKGRARRAGIRLMGLGMLAFGCAGVWAATVEPDRSALETVQAVIAAYNRHDLEGFSSLHSAEMVTVAPAAPPIHGLQSLRQSLPQEWQAFPDAKLDVKRIIADANQVAVEAVWSGTYRKSLDGLPPAGGQPIRLSQMGIYTVRDGRVTSLRSYYNPDDLARQLTAKLAAPKPAAPTLSGVPIPRHGIITPPVTYRAPVKPSFRARPAPASKWKPKGKRRGGSRAAVRRPAVRRAPRRRSRTPYRRPAVKSPQRVSLSALRFNAN